MFFCFTPCWLPLIVDIRYGAILLRLLRQPLLRIIISAMPLRYCAALHDIARDDDMPPLRALRAMPRAVTPARFALLMLAAICCYDDRRYYDYHVRFAIAADILLMLRAAIFATIDAEGASFTLLLPRYYAAMLICYACHAMIVLRRCAMPLEYHTAFRYY